MKQFGREPAGCPAPSEDGFAGMLGTRFLYSNICHEQPGNTNWHVLRVCCDMCYVLSQHTTGSET